MYIWELVLIVQRICKFQNTKSHSLKRFIFLILFYITLIAGCHNKNETSAPNLFSDTSDLTLKVYENSSKIISVNGISIPLKELEEKFIHLKRKGGIVFYSCEGATEDIPENSKAIDLVKKYELTIKIFTDSTFKKSFY